jgi:uncharacterized protein YndB with AHSA1/START domain
MSEPTPDVELRIDLVFEMPGTPEQVWEAVATENGMNAWFMPTTVQERVGGRVEFFMGDTSSAGHITDWDPPRRIAYEEPDWAALGGHADADVTPLATEFLVEAQSGGTCIVRVVSSAFGTGAEWEREFFEEMEKGWTPFFDNMRLYLLHFPGQRVTTMEARATRPGKFAEGFPALCNALGVDGLGPVEFRDLKGEVERLDDSNVLLRLTSPVPGFIHLIGYDSAENEMALLVQGHFFADDAEEFVARERPQWEAWLNSLDLDRT